MARYRNALPQLGGDFFMTDGGIETTLIFLDGQDLPHFAAFHLFKTPEGKSALRKYFRTYKVVRGDEPWAARIRGLRANASRMSHAELNEAPELDAGNPTELGREYAALRKQRLKFLNVMGGCCGTDHRHVEQIASACVPHFRPTT